MQGFSSTRVPWDSSVPEGSGRDRVSGMLVLQKDERVTDGKHGPGVGLPLLCPQHPALHCPPAPQGMGREGLQGFTWDPAAGSLAGSHSQARAKSPAKGQR